MTRLRSRRQVVWFSALLASAYTVSYLTRVNYAAVLSEMESSTHISKSLLSMAVTGSFVTYGAGQIVSGACADRVSPKRLVFCGLAVSALMNALVALCVNPYQMLAVWCVNGFAQSFLWPPMMRIMTARLSPEAFPKTAAVVSAGGSVGTALVYLIAPLLISAAGWRFVFVFSAVCGGAMALLWLLFACDAETARPTATDGGATPDATVDRRRTLRFPLSPLLLVIMATIVLHGMLRDVVATWMPSYLSETFHMSASVAIFMNVVLPLFATVCLPVASVLYQKRWQNPMQCTAVFFAVSAVASCAMLLFYRQNVAVPIVSAAILTGCMYGANLILISMIPPFFKKTGAVAGISGVLNACTYVGSAVSTYGSALFTERFGWNGSFTVWLLITVVGTALCVGSVRPWRRRFGTAPPTDTDG